MIKDKEAIIVTELPFMAAQAERAREMQDLVEGGFIYIANLLVGDQVVSSDARRVAGRVGSEAAEGPSTARRRRVSPSCARSR